MSPTINEISQAIEKRFNRALGPGDILVETKGGSAYNIDHLSLRRYQIRSFRVDGTVVANEIFSQGIGLREYKFKPDYVWGDVIPIENRFLPPFTSRERK